ncbi:MAG TPA: hypothetical protein VM101_06190 [Flavitalea sp.]|nr:hypothetical protein [Flavitalea sp.]
MHMQNAGFKPIVRMEWRDIKNIDGYGFRKFLWRENYVFVRHCHTTVNTILLRQSGKRDHVIEIPYGYNIPASKHIDCIAPFPMDPTQNVNYSAIVEQLPTIRRTVKVLFSGKTTGKLYGKERLKMFFNHISRPEVIHFIFSRFPNRVRSLKTTEDTVIFRQLLDSTDYSNQIIISEVKTDPKDWFNILAKADFFLSAPGARMPWCHNTVEAMAVGTIPIIQYGDLYDPPLEHMKTCIRYNSLEELQTVIEQVLNMEQIEIDKLRRNVREYYNDYLSTDSITKKINSFFSSNKEKLTVAVPFIPTRAEAIAIPAHQL